jgi:hypothetical protein
VPEIIDTVFAKTSPKRSFSMTEYECFGLVFTKTRVYKFGHSTVLHYCRKECRGYTHDYAMHIFKIKYKMMYIQNIDIFGGTPATFHT